MAKFYVKNGNCMEEKNFVQVDPDDTVMWISIRSRPLKRSEISEENWESVIANENARIIVDKNNEGMYILV